jgi:hypothetical protein
MNTGMNDLVPSEFFLSQNYPNPFSEKTIIKFCVPYSTKVKLEVFDTEGKLITKLLDEEKEAGSYEVEFSAIGEQAPSIKLPESEIYFYQLEAGNYKSEKKMIFSK